MPRSDEEQIRALIVRWAAAAHGGDIDGVLVDHSEDIVMFDVPPPHDGVRGLAALLRERLTTPARRTTAGRTGRR
jgi:ketosteroid isomerase-like protein